MGILRTVLLVVLRITNQEGNILVQIAETKMGELVPKCVLPGGKMREGETTSQAANRVLKTDLSDIGRRVKLGTNTSKEREMMQSQGYRVNSMYIKTIFHSSIDSVAENTCRKLISVNGVPDFITELEPIRLVD